jgi:hypothetical protein
MWISSSSPAPSHHCSNRVEGVLQHRGARRCDLEFKFGLACGQGITGIAAGHPGKTCWVSSLIPATNPSKDMENPVETFPIVIFPFVVPSCGLGDVHFISGVHLYFAAHFPQQFTHLWITQNGWLREIPGDMPLCQRNLLGLRVQGNPPDLLIIALQPLFSLFSAIHRETLSNRVAGCSIDLVQGRWLIAEQQLTSQSYHAKSTPGQVMPNFCSFGQELPLWKRSYAGSVSVKMSGRGQVITFLAAI